ncbi:MAG: MoaD/ThiS family protein [Chloroflexi bacterium]|nr:MoaD/ThiS family protein [Chloroflexota bacterium]
MQITVRASGSLKELIPAVLILEDRTTVGDALAKLALPGGEGLAIIVNGRLAHWGTVLQEGDVLQLAPIPSGG